MQRTDMWRRWKAGQSLHENGRAFGKNRVSIQMLGVERISSLPDDQRDRCDLPRQRQARHLRPDSFGHQSRVELLERPRRGGGDDGCALKNVFQFRVVIAVERPATVSGP